MDTDDKPPKFKGAVPFEERFQLVRRLAMGGMAEVLLARPLPAIGQEPVVVKRILPRYANQPEFVAMFHNEARVAQLLRHPNIVRTFEFGTAEDAYFIAMEYLDGVTTRDLLQACLRRGEPVPYGHAIAIVSQVCAGLHHAHELTDRDGKPLQLVHRDVSPQNVVVTRQGAVKLLDFGIAKSLAAHGETGVGKLKGKLAYLSPEQCRGVCDRRSDVFAAGLLFYELTIGQRAYRGANEDEVVTRVVTGRIDPPRLLRSDYPLELAQVLGRALARSPDGRYATAAEFAAALEEARVALALESSPTALAALVACVQADQRAIALATASPPPALELSVAGTIEPDAVGETTDVEGPLGRARREGLTTTLDG
jgi:serine/threonine-protein kinase